MSDDRFDEALARRLRGYEGRLPSAPLTTEDRAGVSRQVGWAVLSLGAAGVLAAAMLAFVVLDGLLDAPIGAPESPTPSPSMSVGASPSASASPSAMPTPTDSASPDTTASPVATELDIAWRPLPWDASAIASDVFYDETDAMWIVSAGQEIRTSTDASTWTIASVESAGCETADDRCSWEITGLERIGDRLLALGHFRSTGSDTTALVSWMSTDGSSWKLSTLPRYGNGQAPATAESNGIVLVASPYLTGPGAPSVFHTTSDGATWDSSNTAAGHKIFAVHGDQDGFVGVGVIIEESFSVDVPNEARKVVQWSADGHAWSTLTVGLPEPRELSAVTRSPSGRYVAAGVDDNGQVVVWTSNGPDEPWTINRLGEPGDPVEGFTYSMLALDSGPEGVVLMANTGAGQLFATSVDGQTWRVHDMPPDATGDVPSAVGIAGDVVLAFGGRANPENGYVAGPPPSAWIGTVGTPSD